MVSFEALSGFITSTILMLEKILNKYNFSFCKENNDDLKDYESYEHRPNR